ncbi:MAG: hypothetical protein IBJ12_16300 [Sphingomonadaceae bacterium]|nr:hypothetical protein [Sphingomonadaceae bacterium]
MGEAKRRMDAERRRLLDQAESWMVAPSEWEAALVEELLDAELECVPRMSTEDLAWMRMPANRCHENCWWYEANDPTGRSKAVTGWWLQGLDFVLHTVMEADGRYCCITPSMAQEPEIYFIPDPKLEWIKEPDRIAVIRNGQEVDLGVRRFPAFTIAWNQMLRDRLLAGMNPHQAIVFTREEMLELKRTHMTVAEISSLEG